MAQYCIGVHLFSRDLGGIRQAVVDLMATAGFSVISDCPMADVVDDDSCLPSGEDWLGLISSSVSTGGWVSVYVDDWQDSGLIATSLSQIAPVLEVWVSEDTHWGYNHFVGGQVKDRFASAPSVVAENSDEAELLLGNADALKSILKAASGDVQSLLDQSRSRPDQLPAVPVSKFAAMAGLNFEHVYAGYEQFFDEDPEDYSPGLESWSDFHFYAFQHDSGKVSLSE